MLKDEYYLELPERNIEFTVINTSNIDSSILVDLSKFRRIIANIIGNAIKYVNVEKFIVNIAVSDKYKSVVFEISGFYILNFDTKLMRFCEYWFDIFDCNNKLSDSSVTNINLSEIVLAPSDPSLEEEVTSSIAFIIFKIDM